jgi:hypothetical protein
MAKAKSTKAPAKKPAAAKKPASKGMSNITENMRKKPEVEETKSVVPSEKPPKVTKNITEAESVVDSAASVEVPKEATPQPNVIWSSEKDADGNPRFGNPPSSPVKIGFDFIEVPDADTQQKGFYSPHARRLVRSVNGFKFLQPKG